MILFGGLNFSAEKYRTYAKQMPLVDNEVLFIFAETNLTSALKPIVISGEAQALFRVKILAKRGINVGSRWGGTLNVSYTNFDLTH